MMVLRKLAVALLSAGVMLPGLGHALAVKELQTKSALGEPFRAEVELIELGDLAPDEVKVSLGSQDDFDRVGVERVYFLTDLKFDVEINPAGRSFIRVTSSKPVIEPYLDFVVRIAWPGNARLHEVTALLDPPVVADSTVPSVSAPVATGPAPFIEAPVAEATQAPEATDAPGVPEAVAPEPVLAAPVPAQPAPPPAPAVSPPAPRPAPVATPDSYRVAAGDTMSRIAERVRAEGVTTSQAMIALQRANPSAFANNNINQVKRGQVLRVPSESQMREVSAQEAAASVREQTAAWQATAKVAAPKPALEAAQVDATAKAPAPAPAPAPASKPEMKLLGTQTGKAGTAAAGKEQGATTKPEDTRKLAQVKSLTESAKTEKQKLAGKVETLDAQIKANDKKVELQNARMAELEAQVREQQARAEAAKAAKAPEAAKPADAPKPADSAPTVAAVPDAPEVVSDAAAPAAPAKPVEAPKPKPVVVEEAPAAEGSIVPMLAGGVAALLAILGGGYWWNQRRRREQDEAEATLAELEGVEGDTGFAAGDGPVADDGLDDSWLNEPAAAAAPAATDRVLADPLEEAEQYIAYERYPQAVGLLTKAIAASPDRADLRMKLLEVYAHLDDWNGFAAQEAWFEQAGDLEALSRAEELKAGLTPPAAGSVASAYDDGSLDFAMAPKAGADDSLPSLEDLEMDFNSSVNVSSPALDVVQDDDLDLDFAAFESSPAPAAKADALDELSFELDNDVFADQAPAVAADEGLDFALDDAPAPATGGGSLGELADLDSDLDFMSESPASAPAPEPVDDGLSFSLDDLEVAAAPVSEPEVSLDEDFNLDAGLEEPALVAAADDDLAFAELDSADLSDGDFGSGAGEFSLDEADMANTSLDDIAADFDSTVQLEPEAPAAVAPAVVDAGADLGMDDEFDFLADTDENATKLDLARAYIDMGDMEGARDILQEVLSEGNSPQKDEAKGLLAQVG